MIDRDEAYSDGMSIGSGKQHRPFLLPLLPGLLLLTLPAFGAEYASGLRPVEGAGHLESRKIEAQGQIHGAIHGVIHGSLRGELVDPCLGSHWMLRLDPMHPDWPGRLIQLGGNVVENAGHRSSRVGGGLSGRLEAAVQAGKFQQNQADSSILASIRPTIPVVMAIRAGDRVTVDQETPFLHARLEAVALDSAEVGKSMRVRLSARAETQPGLNGAVISVMATGTGQARWLAAGRSEP